MGLLTYFIFITAFACFACASTQKKHEPAFGLTFTPTTILASRFNASGAIELTTHSASPEYRGYYDDAVHGYGSQTDGPDINKATSMFRHAVAPLSERLRMQLGHLPEYRVLFLPSVFHPAMRIAALNAIEPDNSDDRPVKFGPSRQAACQGYGFLQGKHLGRAPEECNNEDGPPNLILLLEYEKEYLYSWLMDVAFEFGTFPVSHQKICKECGDRFRENMDAKAYEERVGLFLSDFISNEALQGYDRDSIRAIVISGEASSLGITELGVLALRVVGIPTVKVMTEIAPSEVVAHGAAVWARQVQESPHRFIVRGGSMITGHDEL